MLVHARLNTAQILRSFRGCPAACRHLSVFSSFLSGGAVLPSSKSCSDPRGFPLYSRLPHQRASDRFEIKREPGLPLSLPVSLISRVVLAYFACFGTSVVLV